MFSKISIFLESAVRGYDRLLDIGTLANVNAHALPLARQLEQPWRNLNAEDPHSLLDLYLAGIDRYFEDLSCAP